MSALHDLLSSAASHAASGRIDDALVAYRGALELAPSPELHHNVGVLLFSKGEMASAEQSFVDAARLNPNTVMPSYYVVDGLNRVGKPWQARPVLSAEQVEDVVAGLRELAEY